MAWAGPDKGAAKKHGPIAWSESYEKAVKMAAKDKKLIMADFWAEWCGPCKQMLKTTYRDKNVVARSKKFVPLLINIDKQQALAAKYQIEAIPTVLFLDAKGKVVYRTEPGYQSAGGFLKSMDEATRQAKKPAVSPVARVEPPAPTPPALNFTVKDIDGNPVNLGTFGGDVILAVNVASFCGMTPQYASLQNLYEKYRSRGFVVLGFPANEFGKQEPGSDQEIKEFCSTKYKVSFPMFSKIVVKGEGQHPLYAYLTGKETNPKFAGDIEWNFTKFLINRKGEVVARIPFRTDPGSPEVVAQVEKLLAEPKS